MITLLILVPIFGSIHILISNTNRSKLLSLIYSIINIIVSLLVWYGYSAESTSQQYVTQVFTSTLYTLEFGIDGLSLVFVLLTTFTIPLCVLASWSNLPTHASPKYYQVILLIFSAFTNIVWLAQDLFIFYISFEAVLVPLFLIIGIYSTGVYTTRMRAAYLLFLYTFTGSLFILLSFAALYYYTGSSNISILSNMDLDLNFQQYVWVGIFLSLAIKTPIVPFHNWILRAHVEAPVAGSMVLAGLTLKIATYGILRILIGILPEASIILSPIAITIALISIFYASAAAIRQSDIKCIIAYSSVAHIGVSILGLFSINYTGILGSVILSLSHGWTSPALFFILGGVIYDRFHSRTLKYYRGLTLYIPLIAIFFFGFTLANAGTPLTANWIGELYCLTGAYLTNPYLGFLGATTVFFSACYSIWLFNRISFGSYSPYLSYTTDLTRREFIVLLSLIIPVLVVGIYPAIFTNILESSLSNLLLVTP